MAKYVFFNFPAYGHVNPTLAIVEELIAHHSPQSHRTSSSRPMYHNWKSCRVQTFLSVMAA